MNLNRTQVTASKEIDMNMEYKSVICGNIIKTTDKAPPVFLRFSGRAPSLWL